MLLSASSFLAKQTTKKHFLASTHHPSPLQFTKSSIRIGSNVFASESIMSPPKTGKKNPAQDDCFELQICPDLLLAALAAAAAAAFTSLYIAITMNGRKRRSLGSSSLSLSDTSTNNPFQTSWIEMGRSLHDHCPSADASP